MATIVSTGLPPLHADADAEHPVAVGSLHGDGATFQPPLSAAHKQRLAHLKPLAQPSARSDDRARPRTRSAHHLGLVERSRKDAADPSSSVEMLARGYSSDDDFDQVALLIPSAVSRSWPEAGEAAVISPWDSQTTLPDISQAALDLEPETAHCAGALRVRAGPRPAFEPSPPIPCGSVSLLPVPEPLQGPGPLRWLATTLPFAGFMRTLEPRRKRERMQDLGWGFPRQAALAI